MKHALLALLLLLTACSEGVSCIDTAEARRPAHPRYRHLGGQADVISAYSWTYSWWGSDASGQDLPEHGGDSNGTATMASPAPTLGRSTAGLDPGGIPVALVDNAIYQNSTPVGWTNIGSGLDLDEPGTGLHVRLIFKHNADTNGNFLWYWYSGATDYMRVQESVGSAYAFSIRTSAENTNLATNSAWLDPGDWALYDIRYVPSTGVVSVSLNGAHNTITRTNADWPTMTNLWLGTWGAHNGAIPSDVDGLFLGARDGTLTNEQHESDLIRLGITDVDP